jgi:hypothetical protein
MAKYWYKAVSINSYFPRGCVATTWQGWTFSIGMMLLWVVGSVLTSSWLEFGGLFFFVVVTAGVVVRTKTDWSRE